MAVGNKRHRCATMANSKWDVLFGFVDQGLAPLSFKLASRLPEWAPIDSSFNSLCRKRPAQISSQYG